MRTLGLTALAALAAAGTGCGAPPDAAPLDLETSAISPTDPARYFDFTDGSGAVIVRMVRCEWSQREEHPSAACITGLGFNIVGGGVEIEGDENPGALLTGSWPGSDTTWAAMSKDQHYVYPHRLRPYVIGLRLADVPESVLRSYMWFPSVTSGTTNHPTAHVDCGPNGILIGGGARAQGSASGGQLLTQSYPSGNAWLAASKDHGIVDPGTVTAYGVCITNGPIPGFGTLQAQTFTSVPTFGAPMPDGYARTSLVMPSGWALTSVGGVAVVPEGNPGRLLSDLIPTDFTSSETPGVGVSSKDHQFVDEDPVQDYTIGYAIGLRKAP